MNERTNVWKKEGRKEEGKKDKLIYQSVEVFSSVVVTGGTVSETK